MNRSTDDASFERRLRKDLKSYTDRGTTAPTAKPDRPHTTVIKVLLSVRHVDAEDGIPYGNAFRFLYTDKSTISALQAEINARAAAKRNGYVVWANLGVEQVDA